MKKFKAVSPAGAGITREDMELINSLSKSELSEGEVYTFSLRLCDNEIDRDFERFTGESLHALAALFVGKSGIFDHSWTAKGQKSRIYRCEVVKEPGVLTGAGDESLYLKAYAYMLRTEENGELIREIEAGIKKEVSIGCSVSLSRCCICGESIQECGHVLGREYSGKLCYAELIEPTDAFEWSFVAVPAQREAGVIKAFEREETDLAKISSDGADEITRLKAEAEMGRRYMERLRTEMVRLGRLAEPSLSGDILKGVAQKMDEGELLEFTRAYGKKLEKAFPPAVQLGAGKHEELSRDNEFLI